MSTFKPRAGMKYSLHPVPKLWRVVAVGVSCFCTSLYCLDMHTEMMRRAQDLDTGDIHWYPLTDPPAVWDEHVKRGKRLFHAGDVLLATSYMFYVLFYV